jgi:broad specificity phosphatase PhoE
MKKHELKTTIHFIRHGEVYNPTDILYARIPRFRLNDTGRQQARSVAEYFQKASIAAIFHSPMLRARQTARIIATDHHLKLQETSLLDEIYTPYEGRPYKELRAIDWNIYKDIPSEYEQPEEILQRVRKFSERVLRTYAGREVIGVTHGDIVLHAQMWARGMALTHENRISIQPYPAPCSITTLVFGNNFDKPEFRFHVPT